MPAEASIAATICASGMAVVLLARICWTDFLYMKIWNVDLVALLAIAVVLLIVKPQAEPELRIGLAALFFSLSFVFWMFGTIGAGDVKLLGVVGLLIEPQQAIAFLVLNLAFVALIHLALQKSAVLRFVPQFAGRRILAIADTGRIPYGVAISFSAAALLVHATFGLA